VDSAAGKALRGPVSQVFATSIKLLGLGIDARGEIAELVL